MARTPLSPGLYDPAQKSPRLNGTTCLICDSTFFPPVTLGCQKCGALPEQLQQTELTASGTLYSVATFHKHAGKGIEAPFTAAEVRLDGGPLIRALMDDDASVEDIGKRVSAVWTVVSTDEEGAETVEPRFIVDEDQAAGGAS